MRADRYEPGRPRPSRPSTGSDDPSDRSLVSIAISVAIALLTGTLIYMAFATRADQEEPASSPPASAVESIESDDVGPAPQASTVEAERPPTGTYVRATLDGRDFLLEGVVPSAEIADRLLRAAEITYSPFVRSELMVDEQLDPVGWLAGSPQAIVLLPTITEGSLLLEPDRAVVSGSAPSSEWAERLGGAVGQVTGLPVVVEDMEVTGLRPPQYTMAAIDRRVEQRGVVPSETIRAELVAGAVAVYGEEGVDDRVEVDPGVHTSLWMYNGASLMQAMSVFPEYELRIDGIAFSGYIRGGVTFETGSAEFTPDYARVLDVGVSVLTRDQSLRLVIEGHTDADGPAEANLALSRVRAEAVRDYFVENGIDPDRLEAVGLGETVAIAPNDTPDGRARNRRIEFKLTSILDGRG